MNVLGIGAHPDDLELGCGATLAKHIAAGDKVSIVHLSSGVGARLGDAGQDRQAMAGAAAAALGAYDRLVVGALPDQGFDTISLLSITREIEAAAPLLGWPDVVYTHHSGDLNLDHAITARAAKTAFRPRPGVKSPRILAFEVLSSTELGAVPFVPNVFVDVDGEPLQRKINALTEYGDEIPAAPHPRSLRAVLSLTAVRGAAVGLNAAEAFVLIREVIS